MTSQKAWCYKRSETKLDRENVNLPLCGLYQQWRTTGLRCMGAGRGAGGDLASSGFWNFTFPYEIFSKKGCFLIFEWVKWNFTTFAPLFMATPVKIHYCLLEQILPTPMLTRKHYIFNRFPAFSGLTTSFYSLVSSSNAFIVYMPETFLTTLISKTP